MASTKRDSHPSYLSPSELGTKDYWETFYARTLSHIASKQNPTPPEATTPAASTNLKSTIPPLAHDAETDDEGSGEDTVDDDDDPGTSWFSEHDAPKKVLRFLTSKDFPLSPRNVDRQSQNYPSVLDLGTGNGSMLALLRKKGKFKGPMVGVDYSPRSVELARQLQCLRLHSAYQSESESEPESGGENEYSDDENEDGGVVVPTSGVGESEGSAAAAADEAIPARDSAREEEHTRNIRFEEWDILASSTDALSDEELRDGKHARLAWFPYENGGFDIVLDKGTFDAVSLSDQLLNTEGSGMEGKSTAPRRACDLYPAIAKRLVRRGGFLVVTSCNWTEEELIRWFTGMVGSDVGQEQGAAQGDQLAVWGRVEYPRFRFGGREGQGVCTVCFQKTDGQS